MSIDEFRADLFPDWVEVVSTCTHQAGGLSFLGDTELFDHLLALIRPLVLVEVGSWMGHSANYFASKSRDMGLETTVIAVDTFLGSIEHWTDPTYREQLAREYGRPTTYYRFLGNLRESGNADRILPMCLDSRSASRVLRHYGVHADMIYIDAGHDYEDVLEDLRSWYPLLSPNGVIFGDDAPHGPVTRAVEAYADTQDLDVLFDDKRRWVLSTPGFLGAMVPFAVERTYRGRS